MIHRIALTLTALVALTAPPSGWASFPNLTEDEVASKCLDHYLPLGQAIAEYMSHGTSAADVKAQISGGPEKQRQYIFTMIDALAQSQATAAIAAFDALIVQCTADNFVPRKVNI